MSKKKTFSDFSDSEDSEAYHADDYRQIERKFYEQDLDKIEILNNFGTQIFIKERVIIKEYRDGENSEEEIEKLKAIARAEGYLN
jgi:hypothetical protein